MRKRSRKRLIVKRCERRKRVKPKSSAQFSKIIQLLRSYNENASSKLIRHANDKFVRDIVSHIKQLRYKTEAAIKTMKQYSKSLHLIANPKISLAKKRRVLAQKGGVLPAILPLIDHVIPLEKPHVVKPPTAGERTQLRLHMQGIGRLPAPGVRRQNPQPVPAHVIENMRRIQ